MVHALLENINIWRKPRSTSGPILVVCYTNHALDQFLEGVADLFENLKNVSAKRQPSIVRIGGRCKSEKLDKFSLHKVAKEHFKCMPSDYHELRIETRERISTLQIQRSKLLKEMQIFANPEGNICAICVIC